MKKGFTMIELVFVIVILGILAAVAIPRLAATRDDAEIAKGAEDTSTVVKEFTTYYYAQGKIGGIDGDNTDLKSLSNVKLVDASATHGGAAVAIQDAKGTDCIIFETANADKNVTNKVVKGDPALYVYDGNSTSPVCRGIQSAVNKTIDGSPYRLGGLGVKFN